MGRSPDAAEQRAARAHLDPLIVTPRVDGIGAGRVGLALHARARRAGLAGTLVGRDTGWEALDAPAGTPVLVLTRNDHLDAVVDRVPPHRLPDLVVVQNGMVRPWLARRGLHAVTRGLLYFAVPARGDDLSPGPEPSPFSGPHAEAVVAWLTALDVPAVAVDDARFRALELDKLLWIAAFGVLGQAFDVPVGAVCDDHADTLRALVAELASVAAPALGVAVPPGGADAAVDALVASLCAYSRSIPDWRASVKEWPWRNGWFVEAARAAGVTLPVHDALLARVGLP